MLPKVYYYTTVKYNMPLKRLVHLNTKECLWIYILRILKDRPTHAYSIRKEIETRFGFKPGTMTAYKVLYQLKLGGLVTKKTQGRKRVYSITPRGRSELKKALDFYRERVRLLSK